MQNLVGEGLLKECCVEKTSLAKLDTAKQRSGGFNGHGKTRQSVSSTNEVYRPVEESCTQYADDARTVLWHEAEYVMNKPKSAFAYPVPAAVVVHEDARSEEVQTSIEPRAAERDSFEKLLRKTKKRIAYRSAQWHRHTCSLNPQRGLPTSQHLFHSCVWLRMCEDNRECLKQG